MTKVSDLWKKKLKLTKTSNSGSRREQQKIEISACLSIIEIVIQL